jgi:hypothetical protein
VDFQLFQNVKNLNKTSCHYFRQYDESHYSSFTNNNNNETLYSNMIRKYNFLNFFLYTFPIEKEFDFHTTKYHCAIIEKGGKVISYGKNKVASPSNGGSCSGGKNHMHAEISAVKNLGNLLKLNGANMYIIRVGKMAKNSDQYVFKYSQPCPGCTKFLNKCIKKYGLQNIYFTCDNKIMR